MNLFILLVSSAQNFYWYVSSAASAARAHLIVWSAWSPRDQKLSSGLLLTFTFTLLFQFRIADTEQICHIRQCKLRFSSVNN